MDLGLQGRRALVLGGSRGIGRAIADIFAAEGAAVALCARNKDQVTQAVQAIERHGVNAYGEALDIADASALKAFVANAARTLGGLDMVVSNASALIQGSAPADWKAMLDIDILGVVNLVEAALPHLEDAAKKRGDASIVAISSVSAVMANQASAYGAMKAALIHLIKGYARGLASKKIRANAISPGSIYFEGGVWHRIEERQPDFFKQMVERNPLKRMGSPEEIANAAVFLASPRSSFTTGANLIVDGAITDRANY